MTLRTAQPASTSLSSLHNTVQIEGPLILATVADWHGRLLESLASPSCVEIDLSRVTEMDAFGVQLLCSAHRSVLESGGTLTLTGLPPVVHEACAAVGLNLSAFSA